MANNVPNILFVFASIGIAITFTLFINPLGSVMSDATTGAAVNFVESGTLEVNPKSAYDISIVDGKFYSALPIGATLIAIPYYYLSRPLIESFPVEFYVNKKSPRLSRIKPYTHNYNSFLLQFILVVFFVLPLVILFFKQLLEYGEKLGMHPQRNLLLCLTFIFGSLFFANATVYSRQVVAGLLMWIGYLYFLNNRQNMSLLSIFFISFIINFSVTVEYLSAILVTPLALYLIFKFNDIKKSAIYIFGGLIPLGIIMSHHYLTFGSIFETPYHNLIHFTEEYSHSLLYGGVLYNSIDPANKNFIMQSMYFKPFSMHFNLNTILRLLFGSFRGFYVYFPLALLSFLVILKQLKNKKFNYMNLAYYLIFLVLLKLLSAIQGEFFWSGTPFFWGQRYFIATSFLIFLIVFNDTKLNKYIELPFCIVSICIGFIGAMNVHYLRMQNSEIFINPDHYYHFSQNPIFYGLKQFFVQGPYYPLSWYYDWPDLVKYGLLLVVALYWIFFVIVSTRVIQKN